MIANLSLGRFLGTSHQRLDVAGLVLIESKYPARAHLARHAHEHAYACFVVAGNFSASYGPRMSAHAAQGSLSFHPAGEEHENLMDTTGATTFNIQFGSAWHPRLDEVARVKSGLRFAPATIAPRFAAEAYRHFHVRDPLAHLSLEGLALGILAEVGRVRFAHTTRRPAWWSHALEFIHAHYRQTFSLAELSAAAGVHPVHLARSFRSIQGCTVGAFVRRLRVDHAIRLMRSPDLTLARIAFAAGFADQSHFTSVFKRAVGITPSAFRAALEPRRIIARLP
jgi:AraC family transcriptional regulator